jgi:hypothetical protein
MLFNRILPIVSVMLVSFVLTLAYGYWRQRPAPAAAATATAPSPVSRDGVPMIERAAPPGTIGAENGSAPPARPVTAAKDDTQQKPKARQIVVPPRNVDGPTMPVVFSISSRVVNEAEDVPGVAQAGSRRILEGVVYNSSDQNLQLTITEQNPETLDISQTQVLVLAGVQQRFGADDGLKMASGAEVTLHSDPYRDQSQRVP